jgi:hypothetical protein
MCRPSRYMVIGDVFSLPLELPKIYQRHIRSQGGEGSYSGTGSLTSVQMTQVDILPSYHVLRARSARRSRTRTIRSLPQKSSPFTT